MKLDTVENFTAGNIQNNNSFSIKASAHAFQVLSNGLYSDKIKAIVRELSTNAIDSHVAKGNLIPFEIKLPNVLDSSFHIKDFGIGLSKNEIIGYTDEKGLYHSGIYNTYFESTKQNSNDFIGALGLGSKTPFNYVSSFYVISNYEGIESTYLCYLNDQFVPTVSLITENLSEEHSGLTIKFNVEPKDFGKFRSSVEDVYTYLTIKPNVVGGEIHIINQNYIDKGFWKIRTTGSFKSGAQLIQGGIAYPIDHNALRNKLESNKFEIINNNVDIFVNIGDVDIAASREQLSYTTKTIDFLCDIINKIYTDFHQEIQSLIDNSKTIADLCNIQQNLYLASSMYTTQNAIKLKAKELLTNTSNIQQRSENHDLIRFLFPNFNVNVYSRNYSKWSREIRNANDLNLFGNVNSLLIVNKHKLFKTEIADLCESYYKSEHKSRIYVVDFIDKDFTDVEKIFTCFNSVVYTLPAQRKRTVSSKSNIETAYTWSGFRSYQRKYSSYCWSSVDVDYELGGVYVDIKNFAVYNGEKVISDISEIISSCKSLKIYDGTIYGIPEKDKKKLNSNWINLFDLIEQNSNITSDVVKYSIYQTISYNFPLERLPFGKFNFKGKIKQVSDFLEDVIKYKDKKNEYQLYVQINGYSKRDEMHTEFSDMIQDIKEMFPMLNYVKISKWLPTETYKEMIEVFYNYTMKGE